MYAMLHTIGRHVMTRHDPSWPVMTCHEPFCYYLAFTDLSIMDLSMVRFVNSISFDTESRILSLLAGVKIHRFDATKQLAATPSTTVVRSSRRMPCG